MTSDISDKDQTKNILKNNKLDVVVHCVAYTIADKAEDEKEKCYAINVEGTKNIAEVVKR